MVKIYKNFVLLLVCAMLIMLSGCNLFHPEPTESATDADETFIPTVSFFFDGGWPWEPMRIVGLNPDGEVLFDRIYDDYSDILAYAETCDGGLVFAATTEYYEHGEYDDGVFPIGSSLASYMDMNYEEYSSVYQSRYKGALVRLGVDGDILWQYPLTRNVETVDSISVTRSGDIYTAGVFHRMDVGDQSTVEGWRFSNDSRGLNALCVMRFTDDGNMAASKIKNYEDVSLDFNEHYFGFDNISENMFKDHGLKTACLPNGEFVVLTQGLYYGGGSSSQRAFIIDFDRNLNIVWEDLALIPISKIISKDMSVFEDRILIVDPWGDCYRYYSTDGRILGEYRSVSDYDWGNRVHPAAIQDAMIVLTDYELYLCRDGETKKIDTFDDDDGYWDIDKLNDGRFIIKAGNRKYRLYDRDGNRLEITEYLMPNGAPYSAIPTI